MENSNNLGRQIDDDDDIVLTRFTLNIPSVKWLAKISTQYKDVKFHILSMLLLESQVGNCYIQIQGQNLLQRMVEIKKSLEGEEFLILSTQDQSILLNIKMQDPWILNLIIQVELILNYPIIIQSGQMTFQLLGERSKIDKFFSGLDLHAIDYKLIQIGQYWKKSILTKRQEEILEMCLKEEFFTIPRKISLTHLAKKLNISPSALSEHIRKIFYRLGKSYCPLC